MGELFSAEARIGLTFGGMLLGLIGAAIGGPLGAVAAGSIAIGTVARIREKRLGYQDDRCLFGKALSGTMGLGSSVIGSGGFGGFIGGELTSHATSLGQKAEKRYTDNEYLYEESGLTHLVDDDVSYYSSLYPKTCPFCKQTYTGIVHNCTRCSKCGKYYRGYHYCAPKTETLLFDSSKYLGSS